MLSGLDDNMRKAWGAIAGGPILVWNRRAHVHSCEAWGPEIDGTAPVRILRRGHDPWARASDDLGPQTLLKQLVRSLHHVCRDRIGRPSPDAGRPPNDPAGH
jgi:hypothetical protein